MLYFFQKNKKNACRYNYFTPLYQNSWSYDLQFLRYRMWQTEIMGYFSPFYQTKNKKNQNFEKMKKIAGDIIILHRYTKNHNHMLYGSWDIEWDAEFFVILDHFFIFYHPPPPNNLENQNVEKMKKASGDIIIYQKLWSGDIQFLRYGAQQMDGWIDGRKKWHIEVGASPKN